MKKIKLHWQILIAIILAAICGQLSGKDAAVFGISYYAIYVFLGTLFINALKMIIVPLIMSTIISGIASAKQHGEVGSIGSKTLIYYACTSLLAIMIGLMVVNVIQPGIKDGEPVKEILPVSAELESAMGRIGDKGLADIAEIFIRMVPSNIVEAAANGQMLGLIVFSLLFGFFMTQIAKSHAETLLRFNQGIADTMMLITMFVMRFAPIGVFGLVAKTVANTGFSAMMPLLWFALSVLLALAVHIFVALPLLLKFVGGINPIKHYMVMLPAILTSFSSASSSATLPITLECVRDKAGVSNRTSSFVLPLGATVNMDGTALYECVAVMFIAQAYGLSLGIETQFLVVLVALLTSIGVAGIPAASLVAITVILSTIGLPIEAVGLILVTDRVLDMCRTSVNVFGDSCGAVIIARLEGEEKVLSNN